MLSFTNDNFGSFGIRVTHNDKMARSECVIRGDVGLPHVLVDMLKRLEYALSERHQFLNIISQFSAFQHANEKLTDAMTNLKVVLFVLFLLRMSLCSCLPGPLNVPVCRTRRSTPVVALSLSDGGTRLARRLRSPSRSDGSSPGNLVTNSR